MCCQSMFAVKQKSYCYFVPLLAALHSPNVTFLPRKMSLLEQMNVAAINGVSRRRSLTKLTLVKLLSELCHLMLQC